MKHASLTLLVSCGTLSSTSSFLVTTTSTTSATTPMGSRPTAQPPLRADPYADLAAEWSQRNRDTRDESPGQSTTATMRTSAYNAQSSQSTMYSSSSSSRQPSATNNSPMGAVLDAEELARQWTARNQDVSSAERVVEPQVMPGVQHSDPKRGYSQNGFSVQPAKEAVPSSSWRSSSSHSYGQNQNNSNNNNNNNRRSNDDEDNDYNPWSKYMTVSEDHVRDPRELEARLDQTAPRQPDPPSPEEIAQAWASMTRQHLQQQQNNDNSNSSNGNYQSNYNFAATGGDNYNAGFSQATPDSFGQYMTIADDVPAFVDAIIEYDEDDNNTDSNDNKSFPEAVVISTCASSNAPMEATDAEIVIEEEEEEFNKEESSPSPMDNLAREWAQMTNSGERNDNNSYTGIADSYQHHDEYNFNSIGSSQDSAGAASPFSATQSNKGRIETETINKYNSGPSMEDLAREWASMSHEKEDPNANTGSNPWFAPPGPVLETAPPPRSAPPTPISTTKMSGPSMEDLAREWASMSQEKEDPNNKSINTWSTANLKAPPTRPWSRKSPPVDTAPAATSYSPSFEDLTRTWSTMAQQQKKDDESSKTNHKATETMSGPTMADLARAWASMTREEADPNQNVGAPMPWSGSTSRNSPKSQDIDTNRSSPMATPPQSPVATSSMQDLAQAWAQRNKDVETTSSPPDLSAAQAAQRKSATEQKAINQPPYFARSSIPPTPPPMKNMIGPVLVGDKPDEFSEDDLSSEFPEQAKISPDQGETIDTSPPERMDSQADSGVHQDAAQQQEVDPKSGLDFQQFGTITASLIERQAKKVVERNVKSLEELAASWVARTEDKEEAKLASFYKPRIMNGDRVDKAKKKERVRPSFLDTLGRIFSPDPKL